MSVYDGHMTKKPLRCFKCWTIPVQGVATVRRGIYCIICKTFVDGMKPGRFKDYMRYKNTCVTDYLPPEKVISDWNALQLKRLGI